MICEWTSAGEVFSDMLFNDISCLLKSAPPHTTTFQWQWRRLLSVCSLVSTNRDLLISFLTATFDMFFSERCTHLLTGANVRETSHDIKHKKARRTKPINDERDNFRLYDCSVEALIFTIRSWSLKKTIDHIFEATGVILSRFKSLCLRIEIPTSIKTDRHVLTIRIWI